MLMVFKDIGEGHYVRKTVSSMNDDNDELQNEGLDTNERGIVTESQDFTIQLNNVAVITPNRDVIVPSLTLQVMVLQNLLNNLA